MPPERWRGSVVLGACLSAVLAALLAASAQAADFRIGRTVGLLDLTVAYGVSVRTEDADEDLIGIVSGGNATSVNFDDGNQNYDLCQKLSIFLGQQRKFH